MAESEEPVPEVDLHLIGRLPEGSSVKEEDRGEVTEAQLKERLRELPSLSPPPPPPPWVSGPEEPVPVQVETPDSEGQLQIDPWMIHQLEEEQSAPSPIPAYLPSVLRDDQPSPAPLESTDLLANLGQTARQKNEWDYAYYGTGVYEGEDIRIDISGQKVVPGHLELGLETALAGGAAGLATSPLWIPTALATAGTAYAAAEPYLYPAGQLANSAILAGSATEIISGVTMGVTQNLEDTGQISSSQAEYIYPMAEVFGGTGQVTGGVGVATANIVQGVYGAGEFMTSVSESARRGYEGWEVMSDYDAWGTGYTDRYGGYAMPINGEEEAWYQRKQLLAEGRWQTLRELEAGTLGSIRRNDQYDWNRPPLERVYFGEEMDIYERMGVKVEFKPLGEILGRTRPGVIEIDDSLISEDPTLALTVFSHEAHHVEELSLRRSVMQKNYGGYSWRKATYGQIKKGDVFPEGPYNIVG